MGRGFSKGTIEPIPVSGSFALHAVTSGTGPPLVLIHGVAGSNMVWDRIVPLLEPHFTVVRLDLLGYGHSPKPRTTYSPRRHVTAIRATLAQRGIATPSAFVGLSMGSNLMLEYARKWPDEVRDMVAIGFPFYPSEAAARVGLRHNPWTRMALEHPILARVVVPSVWFLGRRTVGLISRRATIYTGAMAKDALLVRYRAFRSSLLECMVHYRLDDALEASGAAPRLFIHGGADEWATGESVRQALAPYAASTLQIIEDAPHNLAVAEPGRTAALILGYLQRRTESSR